MTTRDRTALLLDEMLCGTIAEQRHGRGFGVAVVEDISLVSASDEDLFIHAAGQQRMLVTANISDFAAIAKDWRARGHVHSGIVYVAHRTFSQDQSHIGAMVAALCAAKSLPSSGTETFLRRTSKIRRLKVRESLN